MLSAILKEKTKESHQSLEAVVVRTIKSIRSKEEYIRLLHKFYGFHFPLEQQQDKFLNDDNVPDYSSRRKASLILQDLDELQAPAPVAFAKDLPVINSFARAIGSLYVLEGSTQGGSIVAGMLIKHAGMNSDNTRFFNAYGEGKQDLWISFKDKLDSYAGDGTFNAEAGDAADDTFRLFKEWMEAE